VVGTTVDDTTPVVVAVVEETFNAVVTGTLGTTVMVIGFFPLFFLFAAEEDIGSFRRILALLLSSDFGDVLLTNEDCGLNILIRRSKNANTRAVSD